MAKMGRPIIMTNETIQILEEAFSNDATDLEACFLAKISKSTLYNYQESHPEFLERKEALKSMVKYQSKRLVKKAIDEGDVDKATWLLERKGKDEGYSSRTELTGGNGNDLTIKVINYGNNDTTQLPTETLPVTIVESAG